MAKRPVQQKRGGVDINRFINKSVDTTPEQPYEHQHTFADFGLHPSFLRTISNRGYDIPTEIQDKAIPHVLTGTDLIGIAGTGTGKTAAFLVPVIQQLVLEPRPNTALIITPTRELAQQIFDEFRKLSRGLRLFAATLIGGVNIEQSITAMRRTNHVVIGTPGRLVDMIRRGLLPLEQFNTLVLDEFDRMLDMGFVNDIKFMNNRMVAKDQTLLFSATIDNSQRGIVNSLTDNAIKVTAGTGTQKTERIDQDILRIPRGADKFQVLHELILEHQGSKVILFCETKRQVEFVCRNLRHNGIRADEIHGDKTQRAREYALKKLKHGNIQVLVATDVLARGIDVLDVELVINYEAPTNYNDYVHRIGRTGRAGKTGKAITLIDRG